MAKFKVGDKVKVVEDHKALIKGEEGTVETVGTTTIKVKMDKGNLEWGWYPYRFELISSKGNVMNIKNLFKSKKQKLFEKYVYNGDGIKWDNFAVQKVFVEAFEKELLVVCKELEKKEKEDK